VINGLETGTYSVAYSLAGFTGETAFDVEVAAGTDTAVDPAALAAEAPEHGVLTLTYEPYPKRALSSIVSMATPAPPLFVTRSGNQLAGRLPV